MGATTKAAASKAVVKKTITLRSKDGKKLAGSQSLEGKAAPTANKVARTVTAPAKKMIPGLFGNEFQAFLTQVDADENEIIEVANILYEQHMDSLHYFQPSFPARKAFRLENEKTTKKYLRGSIYNRRGIKVASYSQWRLVESFFELNFVDAASKKSFVREARLNYDASPFWVLDPDSLCIEDELLSRYTVFLFNRKYPKKFEDFLEEAKQIDALERDNIRTEGLLG